jgi:hypothetical protein
MLTVLVNHGRGDLDHSAIVTYIEDMSSTWSVADSSR